MPERAGGSPGALGARLRLPRPHCPPPGCSGLPVGVRGRCPSGRPPSALGPGGGEREGGALWFPDAAPRQPRGGGLAVPAPRGQPSARGAHSSPAPLYPVRAGPSCRPSLGVAAPPAVVARRSLAWGGREGQQSAVSGLQAVSSPSCLLSPPSFRPRRLPVGPRRPDH